MFIFADEHKTIIIMDTSKPKKVQLNADVVEKLKNANSLEELKEIAAKEGYELSDEQLEEVAGGGNETWMCIRDWSCATQTIKPGPPIV